MAIHKTPAVVIGRRALGESDRLVDFYTQEFGKLRGVAKSARRTRSRFGSALELFTLGDLVFFDTGRSELVRVDHFDIVAPFVDVRESLEHLGHGAWTVECVAKLCADRDPHPALFRLVVRTLKALERSRRPAWTAACFALRAVDMLGHRPRLDRCLVCGRVYPFADAVLDTSLGGLVCGSCVPGAVSGAETMSLSGAAVGTLTRLRSMKWDEALRLTLAQDLDREIIALVEGVIARLAGQSPRSSRFLGQVRRSLSRVAEPPARKVVR